MLESIRGKAPAHPLKRKDGATKMGKLETTKKGVLARSREETKTASSVSSAPAKKPPRP